MKCVFCGGAVEKKNTSFNYEEGDIYLVIKNVPAEVCSKCGEKTYSPDITDDLLRFAKKEFKPIAMIEVPVYDYAERKTINFIT
jgi:YgiT-type zinc finger domain-containing protein